MSLRFILGRAGSGKTERSLGEIRDALFEQPQGPPIIYLVPEQMTFQSEYELAKTPGLDGMMRAQVFSFSRLAWKILGDVGGMTRLHITSVGMNMMLRKIIENKKQELRVFKKASEQNGFYSLMETMITEFKRYCVNPEQLEWNAQTLLSFSGGEEGSVLRDKLSDLALIYGELEKALIYKYMDNEDYLRLLAEKIPHSEYVQQADFYIDGFHQFTPQELEVLNMLLKHARRVTVALTLDDSRSAENPHDLDLFYTPKKTCSVIRKIAKEENVMEEEPVFLKECPRFEGSPSLAHLESQYEQRPALEFGFSNDIFISSAVNRRAEVEGAAREILTLVRDKGYRFKDIALSIRNMNEYQDLIETVFEEYEIPVFLDQKKPMLHHPLIELIRSSLETVTANWRYESVFRAVKTDLLYPENSEYTFTELRHEMDELENYVLAYGIQGPRWKDKKPWKVQRFQALEEHQFVQTDEEVQKQEVLNEVRYMIVSPLDKLSRDLKQAETVRDYCEVLFVYLERLHIPDKLERLSRKAQEEGRLRMAREHDQVWDAVIELLDEMVEITGSEAVKLDLWIKMLDTGLESLKFALVPPAIDQVLAGTMDRSRYSGVKCHFVLGVNDGILPAKPKDDGILSEDDRDLLEKNGVALAPGARRQLLDEQFLIYLSLTNAMDKLYIYYPLADEEGKNLLPSMVINRVKSLFPGIPESFIQNDPEYGNDLSYIQRPQKAISHLNTQLREWKKGYPISGLWWDVYNWTTGQDQWKRLGQTVLGSLFYYNQEKKLSSSVTKELYGDAITASVSRMELQNSCAFSHFLSYGLKLQERRLYRLEAPDIGQLFHAALKNMDDYLGNHQMSWRDLSMKDCYRVAGEVVDRLALKLQSQILLSTSRHLYIKNKLSDIVGRASHMLSEHARASGFSPVGLELGFGNQQPLPPLKYTLPNGTSMEIIGRIDRVDSAEGSQGLMLRIIDYKSSSTGLNLSEVYYGIALQMLTYLDVVISHSVDWLGKEAHPAGVLYFHIHNPLLSQKKLLTFEEIQQELFKRFKMKGLVLADTETVQLMDTAFEKKSDIIPVSLTSKGFHPTHSSVATEEDFTSMTRYVRKVIKDVGTDITEGVIDIAPYQMKNKMPCTFCSYRSVCQFDQSLEENQYRLLKQESDDEILAKMREEGGEEE
ncbi:helicase-exonuclease AddAB subunit AddB [Fictibacillus fluitans]|uniref:ATP-dependent helicase/deoxyribonuclease subunit B n=1 Tax=Fictibacillus fluitans TaxID=3058422 RepID=A0ABT8HSI5_9BACL|nr:helicase-exonuclease AddAB subunit AddB [Fictibacillus sp. NE201]MDN4523738.1 helicase-exonuclease AddAB subunit AddB [Fictibacillus sp. NE201]